VLSNFEREVNLHEDLLGHVLDVTAVAQWVDQVQNDLLVLPHQSLEGGLAPCLTAADQSRSSSGSVFTTARHSFDSSPVGARRQLSAIAEAPARTRRRSDAARSVSSRLQKQKRM